MALSKGEIISVLDYPEPTFVCGTLWTAPCCSNGTQDSRIICRRQSKDDWDEIDSISHQKNIQSLVNKKQRQRRPVTPDQLDFSYDDDHHHDNDDDKWSWQRMVHESAWPRLRHSLTQYKKRGQPFPYDRLLMLPDDHEDDNNDCTTDSDSTTSSATDAEDYESDFAYTTLVHVAAWKAPPALMLLLLDVMTTTTANAVSLSGLSHCSSAHSDRTASQKSIETTRQYLLCGDAQGNTPLHLACANLEPNDSFTCEQLDDCKSDDTVVVIDFAVIKNLLVLGQEALEVQNNAGDTPLHLLLASDAFEQEPLRYLNITSKSKSLNMHDDTAQDGFSRTASKRELAAEEAIVSLLHMTGDGLANSPNNTGMTPLHVAIANPCHEAVTRQLIRQRTSQLAVTMADQHGMVPLHYLGAFGRTSRVLAEELIAISPDSIGCLTINGDTPLHLLVTNAATILKNQTNAVPNVDVHTVNQHIVKLAKLLVGTGSEEISPLLIPNDDGMTPLHCCAEFHAPAELTRLLMDSNNTGYYGRIASVLLCKAGSTALHLAVSVLAPSTNTDWFDKDTAWVRNVESNIFALATREACAIFDAHDQTPLMVAVQNKRVSTNVIKRLLETLPKSASTPNSKGYLPIHFACQNRRIKVSTLKGMFADLSSSHIVISTRTNSKTDFLANSVDSSIPCESFKCHEKGQHSSRRSSKVSHVL